MAADGALDRVTVRSAKIADPGALADLLPGPSSFAWLHSGEGLVGWGEAGRAEFSGPDRFAEADRWWQSYVDGVDVQDEVGLPGSGPIAMGAFAFADGPISVLIVPRVVVGRRDGITWRTTVGDALGDGPVEPRRAPRAVRVHDDPGAMTRWRNAVGDAGQAIRSGALAKVVLALSLEARAAEEVDGRELLVRLVDRYPECWGFLLDGMVGATPELLVERVGQQVRSRVLAGTIPRDTSRDGNTDRTDDADSRLGAALLASAKDRSEHRLAVEPLAESLGRLAELEDVPDAPAVLQLRNVAHLATELTGRVREDTSALLLAGVLHPTPAVAGTPLPQALRLIAEMEDSERGRYAGPVGWVDARGDGEFCLALRCAAVQGRSVRLFAGCGIVADSDPDAEVAEWRAKLRPVLDALGL
jgi:menaquinone-specific isochorismate synthase